MCDSVGVEPSLPRLCGRQSHRSNVPAQTPSEYYRRTVTIPVLDHLLSEMEAQFSTHQETALLGLHLIPSILVTNTVEELEQKIQPVKELYVRDLMDDSFSVELHQWHLKWTKEKDLHGTEALPNNLAFTLPQCSSYFANIRILLHILCTLPVTSCSSERSFSALKRVKTPIRSTMSNQRLASLTLLHIHKDIDICISDVVDDFARRHSRRLQLANILSDD